MTADIIIWLIVLALHIVSVLFACCWSSRNFVRQLHYRDQSLAFALMDFIFVAFMLIGGYTFLNDKPALACAICSLVISLFLLPVAVRLWCFCIFIDGNYAVQRGLFSRDIRIRLDLPTVVVDRSGEHFGLPNCGIYTTDDANLKISFNRRRIIGDVNSFLDEATNIAGQAACHSDSSENRTGGN
jgi:hypothetical protein